MLSRVWSSTTIGVDALPVEVETHIQSGMPKFTVVGLPQAAVRESRDRVRAAIKNVGLPVPRGAITINLAPADVRKEGTAFDLPLAIGLLAAQSDTFPHRHLNRIWMMGELALDGSVRPVKGILPMAIRAKKEGIKSVIVPKENASEAAVVHGLKVFPAANVEDAYYFIIEGNGLEPFERDLDELFASSANHTLDFSDVRGQENVKRALEVAAAGGHNTLMVGPPGSGKTMLARRLPGILPPLSPDEALETTKIHSVSGKLKSRGGLVARRPFRSPHHTISDAGLCGGGTYPMPGEISLAHNGVLFLDELPEFERRVLEVLRQPLEEGAITISRAQQTVHYPARFVLIASMNPCPCGYLNDPKKSCHCSPSQVQRYRSRISGPLLDRIDIHAEVLPVPFEKLSEDRGGEPSERVRERVIGARKRQASRFDDQEGIYCNAQMGAPSVRTHCKIGDTGRTLLKKAVDRLGMSARAHDRILKVARTIADLSGSEEITPAHLSEAIQYRSLDRERY